VDGTDDEKLAKFREVRDQIDQHIQGWLAEQRITPLTRQSCRLIIDP